MRAMHVWSLSLDSGPIEVLVRIDDGPVLRAYGTLTTEPLRSWNLTVRHTDRLDLWHVTLTVQCEDTLWHGPGMVVRADWADSDWVHTVVSAGEMLTLDLTKLDDRHRLDLAPNPCPIPTDPGS